MSDEQLILMAVKFVQTFYCQPQDQMWLPEGYYIGQETIFPVLTAL